MDKNDFSFNPIEILENKNQKVIARYNSYIDKLNLYLLVLTIFLSIILFAFGNSIANVDYLMKINNEPCFIKIIKINTIVALFIIFIYLIVISIKVFNIILSALDPVVITDVDNESIDLFLEGKYEESNKILINDLKFSINENQKNINKKYNYLYKINNLFKKLFYGIVFFLCLLFIIKLIGNAFL